MKLLNPEDASFCCDTGISRVRLSYSLSAAAQQRLLFDSEKPAPSFQVKYYFPKQMWNKIRYESLNKDSSNVSSCSATLSLSLSLCRLQNSYTASQRANQDLEEKLHALVNFFTSISSSSPDL